MSPRDCKLEELVNHFASSIAGFLVIHFWLYPFLQPQCNVILGSIDSTSFHVIGCIQEPVSLLLSLAKFEVEIMCLIA